MTRKLTKEERRVLRFVVGVIRADEVTYERDRDHLSRCGKYLDAATNNERRSYARTLADAFESIFDGAWDEVIDSNFKVPK